MYYIVNYANDIHCVETARKTYEEAVRAMARLKRFHYQLDWYVIESELDGYDLEELLNN